MMNELIQQLWKESQQWNGSDDGRGGLKILESVDKFAELIVKECVKHITEQQDLAETNWQCKDGIHIVYSLEKYFRVEY